MKPKLILASGSPRRSALMKECGLEFVVADKYAVEERYPAAMAADDVPLFLADLKSDAYPEPLAPDQILITADTLVLLDDQILGKPASIEEAKRMLKSLSGRTHRVITGVALRSATKRAGFSSTTRVTFATLSDAQIDHYVAQFAPLDKAGAYAIQEWIGAVGIRSIEGSYNNVVGLPTAELCEKLQDFTR